MATLQSVTCCCLQTFNPAGASKKSRTLLSFGVVRAATTALRNDHGLVMRRCNGSSRVLRPRESEGSKRDAYLCLATADPAPEPSPIQADSIVPEEESLKSVKRNWRTSAAELRAKVSKWGLAAVLAYGLFDGITYTTFFVLSFLSYEKSTGQNPALNIKALLGIVVLMWGGNNFTRPFRVAGAAALAPLIDKFLNKMQEVLKLPSRAFAFMICVATFASACLSVIFLLILSRLRG